MALNKGIPCHQGVCKHVSPTNQENILHGSLHFTASVMGNPEYLEATKDIVPAKDQRLVGIERVNQFHAAHHEKVAVKRLPNWSKGSPKP